MKRKLYLWLTAGLCGAALAAALIHAGVKSRYLLPAGIDWQTKTLSQSEPVITLKNKMVTVSEDDSILWQNNPSWRVQDALWCDIDHDDENELLLLCWKRGLYGVSRPFWVEKDPQIWSQHIFIYDWAGTKAQPIWMASQLNREVLRWEFTDADRLLLTQADGQLTRWDWLSWGLTFLEQRPN